MNSIWKVAAGVYKSGFGSLGKPMGLGIPSRCKTITGYSRTMWHMCSSKSSYEDKLLKLKQVTECCQCGCSGLLHTKGEKSLVDFLKTEIVEEKKAQKLTSLPSQLNDFSIEADGAELNFIKKNQLETITVSMNVNHSVITDDEDEGGDAFESGMKSRPTFEVDITRKNSTLSFSCSFLNFSEPEGEKAYIFQIDEVTLFEGEWNEKHYSVAGDILDENLYDLFMSFMSEKGITNDFLEDVSDIATYYEHAQYISLLEGIQKFSTSK